MLTLDEYILIQCLDLMCTVNKKNNKHKGSYKALNYYIK